MSCSTRRRLVRVFVDELFVRLALLKKMTRSPLVMPPCRARVASPETIVSEPGVVVEPRAVSLAIVRFPRSTWVRPSKVLGPERSWVLVSSFTRVPRPLILPAKSAAGVPSGLAAEPKPILSEFPPRRMREVAAPDSDATDWPLPERSRMDPPVPPESRARAVRPFSVGRALATFVLRRVPPMMEVGPR